MAFMVWAPKRAKGAAAAGFARESARRLVASVDASAEGIAGMARCGGGLYFFGNFLSPFLRYINVVALVVEWGRAGVPTFLSVEAPCVSLLQGLVDENFCPWWGHGGPVVVESPI